MVVMTTVMFRYLASNQEFALKIVTEIEQPLREYYKTLCCLYETGFREHDGYARISMAAPACDDDVAMRLRCRVNTMDISIESTTKFLRAKYLVDNQPVTYGMW